jgi:hypothetical protein
MAAVRFASFPRTIKNGDRVLAGGESAGPTEKIRIFRKGVLLTLRSVMLHVKERHAMNKMLVSIGLLTGCSLAGSWSDSLTAAILGQNHQREAALLNARPGNCQAVPELGNVARALRAQPSVKGPEAAKPRKPAAGALAGPWSVPSFEWALRPDFRGACYPEFKQAVLDSTAPETFRRAALKLLLSGTVGQEPVPFASLHPALISLVSSPSTPATFKTFAFRKLGQAQGSSFEQDFLPFLGSSDSALQEAAYQGLVWKVQTNALAGKKDANARLFAFIRAHASQPISMNQVRVLATLREDDSRDYLLDQCAGDPEKIAVIFSRDGNVKHAGLIAEAARLARVDANASMLRKALFRGIKEPKGLIGPLLSGTANEQQDGLTVLAAFPKYAVDFASTITQTSHSPNPELKAAAQKLLPYLQATASK